MKFEFPGVLKEHMIDNHHNAFSLSQLPVLIDMCERPASPEEGQTCPLCGEEISLRALDTHVASHLEEIALFVLSVGIDGSVVDIDSKHAERPRRKDIRLQDDDLSSLDSFSENGGIEAQPQNSNMFNQGLRIEEETPLTQIENWFSYSWYEYDRKY